MQVEHDIISLLNMWKLYTKLCCRVMASFAYSAIDGCCWRSGVLWRQSHWQVTALKLMALLDRSTGPGNCVGSCIVRQCCTCASCTEHWKDTPSLIAAMPCASSCAADCCCTEFICIHVAAVADSLVYLFIPPRHLHLWCFIISWAPPIVRAWLERAEINSVN